MSSTRDRHDEFEGRPQHAHANCRPIHESVFDARSESASRAPGIRRARQAFPGRDLVWGCVPGHSHFPCISTPSSLHRVRGSITVPRLRGPYHGDGPPTLRAGNPARLTSGASCLQPECGSTLLRSVHAWRGHRLHGIAHPESHFPVVSPRQRLAVSRLMRSLRLQACRRPRLLQSLKRLSGRCHEVWQQSSSSDENSTLMPSILA